MNILILRLSAIGDVIHTIPAILMLRHIFSQARIEWVVQEKVAPLLESQKFISNIFVIPDNFLHIKNWGKLIKILKEINKIKWDIIIDFHGFHKVIPFLLFTRGRKYSFKGEGVKYSIGSHTSFLTHVHVNPECEHIIQKHLSLVDCVISDFTPNNYRPALWALINKYPVNYQSESVNNWIKENIKDKYIILAPNTTWESKHWPELHWRSLIVSLKAGQLSGEIPAQIIIVGKDHGKAARALINCESPPDVLFAPNWNLKQTGALIASTLLLVAPDTGLLHLADFLGVQTLGLWGPTRSEWHGPFLFKANRESYLKCDCPHLYKKKHCNTQKTINSHDCMTKIISEHVYEKIRDVVGGSK